MLSGLGWEQRKVHSFERGALPFDSTVIHGHRGMDCVDKYKSCLGFGKAWERLILVQYPSRVQYIKFTVVQKVDPAKDAVKG